MTYLTHRDVDVLAEDLLRQVFITECLELSAIGQLHEQPWMHSEDGDRSFQEWKREKSGVCLTCNDTKSPCECIHREAKQENLERRNEK